jgi:hypothetical protein
MYHSINMGKKSRLKKKKKKDLPGCKPDDDGETISKL